MLILIRGIFVMIRILSIISLLLFSTSSFAEDYDEEIIFNEGAWEVAMNMMNLEYHLVQLDY